MIMNSALFRTIMGVAWTFLSLIPWTNITKIALATAIFEIVDSPTNRGQTDRHRNKYTAGRKWYTQTKG